MRKAMADFARNERVVLPATIDDASVFVEIRRALNQLGYAMSAPEPIVAKLLDWGVLATLNYPQLSP